LPGNGAPHLGQSAMRVAISANFNIDCNMAKLAIANATYAKATFEVTMRVAHALVFDGVAMWRDVVGGSCALGDAKGYDTKDFVADLRARGVTPYDRIDRQFFSSLLVLRPGGCDPVACGRNRFLI
jgi:hypothetical protein